MNKNNKITDNDLVNIAHKIWPLVSAKLRKNTLVRKDYIAVPVCLGKKNEKQDTGIFAVSSVGCAHSQRGGCTMCNFGMKRILKLKIDKKKLRSKFDEAINHFQANNVGKDFCVYGLTTSGSFFDVTEVPADVRKYYYEQILKIHTQGKKAMFGCESRLEYVNEDILKELKRHFPKEFMIRIGYGIESMNSLIRECCVNKWLPEDFKKKIDLLRKYNILVASQIIVKPIFITEAEAIKDAVDSVKQILSEKLSDYVVVMAMGLRDHTITKKLYDEKKYQLPSIWTMIRIIEELGPDVCQNTTFNGFAIDYKDFNYEQKDGMVRGCKKCSPILMPKLLAFKRPSKKEWLGLIEASRKINCACKKEWQKRISEYEPRSLRERITAGLNDVSKEILGKNINYFFDRNQS